MQRTQILTFEVGTGCNLSGVHPKCPNRHPSRYEALDTSRILDNEKIVDVAVQMHERFGFRGLIAWHYYNEPMLYAERLFGLMERIRERIPAARFLLWTNGTLTPENEPRLSMFEQVHLTDYTANRYPPVNVHAFQKAGCKLTVYRHHLDERLNMLGDEVFVRPCHRPFTEFIIDAYGNVHLCCYDWQGLASPGNVYTTPLPLLVARWREIRRELAAPSRGPQSPGACLHCNMGSPWLTRFDLAANEEAERYIASGCPVDMRSRKIAVVFVHYRLPAQRLKEHFEWNHDYYQASEASVYVVTDKEYAVPEYAECVLFSAQRLPKLKRKRVFSLCATKNAGIQAALRTGAEVVICTDADIAFGADSWQQCIDVDDKSAAVPVYAMAENFPERAEKHVTDRGATGTVAMTAANWERIQYDERCIGYGADDGLILAECKRAGVILRTSSVVYHIAHDAGASQKNIPGKGRGDCWNRDNGFNPDNFRANQKLMAKPRDDSGLLSVNDVREIEDRKPRDGGEAS